MNKFPRGSFDPQIPQQQQQRLTNLTLQPQPPTHKANCSENASLANITGIDSSWANVRKVLAEYKTQKCSLEAHQCRRGYGCPFYHNDKDRRRSPLKYAYTSGFCEFAKSDNEWKSYINCPNGDDCMKCHSRTEQQFHPDIYKSNKCNDMMQTNYCPRGYFCAFAHVLPMGRQAGQGPAQNVVSLLSRRNTMMNFSSANVTDLNGSFERDAVFDLSTSVKPVSKRQN